MHRPRLPLPSLAACAAARAAALALAAVGALALGAVARAEAPVIYKWVDENGVAHYTTDRGRIPSAIRDRVIQGGDAARGADWLRRDAGPAGVAPAPLPPGAGIATTPVEREAQGVEHPEDSDGVHAVEAQPDWSQAPGGEATWAPGDLGEEGRAPTAATPPVPPPAETPPVQAAPATETRAAAHAPVPPPPPPPLEADGAPIADAPAVVEEPAVAHEPVAVDEPVAVEAIAVEEPVAVSATPPAPEPAPVPAPVAVDEPPIAAIEDAAPVAEPSAPAAVAAPAPRDLAPDEQEELAALDAQIADVEAKIASEEEAMMVLIGDDANAAQGALVDDPQFRDIAQRLPKLQADLQRLRERRAQIQPVVPTP